MFKTMLKGDFNKLSKVLKENVSRLVKNIPNPSNSIVLLNLSWIKTFKIINLVNV